MMLWVLGGDARSRWAADYFRRQGFAVKTHGVPEMQDCPLPEKFCRTVLPFPSFSGNQLRGRCSISAEDILSRTDPATKIFGGLLGPWKEAFESKGAAVRDLYGTEPLTTGNAVPTAEGAIALAMELSPVTIHGSKCLVSGFGRCGKVLAQKLRALGARVTVGVRKASDRALAEAMSMNTEESGIWAGGLQPYDFIFNTVPASVFSSEQAAEISPGCLFIELASRPGGIALEDSTHLNYHFAPGLPGRAAPKTAGILYARSVLQILEEEGLQ